MNSLSVNLAIGHRYFSVHATPACQEPLPIDNAYIVLNPDNYKLGSEVFYSCESGTTISGDGLYTCKLAPAGAKWSGGDFACKKPNTGTDSYVHQVV